MIRFQYSYEYKSEPTGHISASELDRLAKSAAENAHPEVDHWDIVRREWYGVGRDSHKDKNVKAEITLMGAVDANGTL